MSNQSFSISRLVIGGLFAVLTMVGCGGSDPAPGAANPPPNPPAMPPSGTGTLRVAITDAPACGFDHVYITVDRVRVHTSSAAEDADSGWSEVVVNPPQRIDLLALTNGVLFELGQAPLSAGTYNQARLLLRPNGGGAPANAVVLSGSNVEVPLDTPSATQSGLKLVHSFTVLPNQLVDLLLDFDACRSIVRRGNSGRYNLKPVIAVIPRTTTAIVGTIDPTITGVTVTAQRQGVVLRSTTPNSNGDFVLSGMDPSQSPFDVVITANQRATAVISAVPVTLNASTRVSASGAPIMLATATMGTVGGTVLPVIASASVRALQAVGTVPKVEVAHVNADATTGIYTLSLPIEAPRLAAYSATLPLAFSPQNGNAAAYTLEAFASGYVTQTKPVTASTTPSNNNDFTLVAAP